MSLMSEKDIPCDFLRAAYDDEASELGEDQKVETEWPPIEVDDFQIEKSIGTLAAYAFISKTTTVDSYDLHRLVSLSTRNWLQKENVAATYATQVVMRLNTIFPAPDHENKDLWLRYLPPTRRVLSSPLKPTGDAAKAQLLRHVGKSFMLMGIYPESEKYHEQALELNKLLFGNKHVATLISTNNLGLVLGMQGKYEEAEKMHRETLELKDKVLGKEHPETLSTMDNLSSVLDRQGKSLTRLRRCSDAEVEGEGAGKGAP